MIAAKGSKDSCARTLGISTDLFQGLEVAVKREALLGKYTSLRIGGPAQILALPRTVEALKELLVRARRAGLPVFLLGQGSNLLAPDEGIRGIVVSLRQGFDQIELGPGVAKEHWLLRAGAGVKLQKLVRFSADRNLEGLEFADGIPGSVGGAVAMNAGTRYGEIALVLDSARVLDSNGEVRNWKRAEIPFSYRSSHLPSGSVVLEAVFVLHSGDPAEIRRRMTEYQQYRRRSQPLSSLSAGSIFKTPAGASAGALIDQAGLKGMQRGGAEVSTRHANFIVNRGGATAADVLALMAEVVERVRLHSGIVLEPEIRFLAEQRV
ncbi:MAG TPA: UDP-N-acetylmuramate dehydrogenase [bacterium]|nr:UDP-N-acetylmuramate dehydrogenase [bacterium]